MKLAPILLIFCLVTSGNSLAWTKIGSKVLVHAEGNKYTGTVLHKRQDCFETDNGLVIGGGGYFNLFGAPTKINAPKVGMKVLALTSSGADEWEEWTIKSIQGKDVGITTPYVDSDELLERTVKIDGIRQLPKKLKDRDLNTLKPKSVVMRLHQPPSCTSPVYQPLVIIGARRNCDVVQAEGYGELLEIPERLVPYKEATTPPKQK